MAEPTKKQQKWFDKVAESYRRSILIDRFTSDRSSPACCYVLQKEEKMLQVFIMSPNQSPMNDIKPILSKYKAEAYVFCCEAWIVIEKMDGKKPSMEEVNKKFPKGLKDHPKRQERLIQVFGTTDGYRYMEQFDIIRSKNKRIIELVNCKEPKQLKQPKFVSDKIP